MSAYTDAVDRAATLLGGITNIGKVYQWERFAKDKTTLHKLYKITIGGKSSLRGWCISSPKMPQVRYANQGQHRRDLSIMIRGYASFKDTGVAATTSERVFRDLTETVLDTLDADPRLDGVATSSEPAQLLSFLPVLVAGVLVHRAEIEWTVHINKQITYS